MTRELVSTAKCGHCKSENLEAERLGRVFKHGGESVWRLNWYVDDPVWRRAMRRREPDYNWSTAFRTAATLAFPKYNVTAPEFLDVRCKRHGPGRIPAAAVLGKRGTVWVTFKAPA